MSKDDKKELVWAMSNIMSEMTQAYKRLKASWDLYSAGNDAKAWQSSREAIESWQSCLQKCVGWMSVESSQHTPLMDPFEILDALIRGVAVQKRKIE